MNNALFESITNFRNKKNNICASNIDISFQLIYTNNSKVIKRNELYLVLVASELITFP